MRLTQFRAPRTGREPFAAVFGGGAHRRGQRDHIAIGEDRCHSLALPFPFHAVGIEQAFADGGPQPKSVKSISPVPKWLRRPFKDFRVHCSRRGSHLGHVFPDGPPLTHLRYCIKAWR